MRWSTMVPRTLPDRSFASRTGEASTDTLMPKREFAAQMFPRALPAPNSV